MSIARPNILYILSDQHAARVLGCAGDAAADTPNLDRLATEGTRFTRAYCPSPVCLPSRMSLLTGNRPHEQQCWTNDDILASDRPTWLHALGAHGYRPVLAGRMHALGPDQMHGYTERPIGDHSPNWPGVARTSLGQLEGTSGPFTSSIRKSGAGQSSYNLMDRDVLQEALRLIRQSRSDGRPFCITAGFMLPHPPYVAQHDDLDAVAEKVGPPKLPAAPANEHPWVKLWRTAKNMDAVTSDDIMRARRAYYALVRRLDRNIGELLRALDETGNTENTLVVYLSDHGDHLGERGLFWKHTFYEESVLVPLIFRWPGHIPANKQVDEPVELGGLGGTLLSLVGGSQLPNASMRSFAELITAPKTAKNEPPPVFIEYCTDDLPAWTEGQAVQQRAVILGDFKLVYYHGYPSQLFDLKSDPLEQTDLSGVPAYACIRRKLTDLVLDGWNPEEVAKTIERRKADKKVLKAWAEATQPADLCRWPLRAEQNWLDPNRLEG